MLNMWQAIFPHFTGRACNKIKLAYVGSYDTFLKKIILNEIQIFIG